MIFKKPRRNQYFIHKSSQIRTISLSVLPAMFMTIFCIFMIYNSGGKQLKTAREKPMIPLYEARQIISDLNTDSCDAALRGQLKELNKKIEAFTQEREELYHDGIMNWNKTKHQIYAILLAVMIITGLWALVNSHRIAGPLYRIKKNIDQMADGQDIPPVKLRKKDEFQELAESLERLRLRIRKNNDG